MRLDILPVLRSKASAAGGPTSHADQQSTPPHKPVRSHPASQSPVRDTALTVVPNVPVAVTPSEPANDGSDAVGKPEEHEAMQVEQSEASQPLPQVCCCT